jgi:hypothetical protein
MSPVLKATRASSPVKEEGDNVTPFCPRGVLGFMRDEDSPLERITGIVRYQVRPDGIAYWLPGAHGCQVLPFPAAGSGGYVIITGKQKGEIVELFSRSF